MKYFRGPKQIGTEFILFYFTNFSRNYYNVYTLQIVEINKCKYT